MHGGGGEVGEMGEGLILSPQPQKQWHPGSQAERTQAGDSRVDTWRRHSSGNSPPRFPGVLGLHPRLWQPHLEGLRPEHGSFGRGDPGIGD